MSKPVPYGLVVRPGRLKPYNDAASKMSLRRKLAAVREWAKGAGIEVSDRGRLPKNRGRLVPGGSEELTSTMEGGWRQPTVGPQCVGSCGCPAVRDRLT